MQIFKFEQVLESLESMDSWLVSLGIKGKSDRWHQSAKTLRRSIQERDRAERGEKRAFVPNYVHGLFEALEVHAVLQAFSGEPSPALKEKVKRALCGPVQPPNEEPKNSDGRNTMFELSLAADWKNRGNPVELGEPDIRLLLARSTVLVECKRPFYEDTVLSNIEDAASQLGKELDKAMNLQALGIIAISLSRVFTQNDLVCKADEQDGKEFARKEFDAMIERHKATWRVREFLNFHPRIVAVMFHLAVPWDIHGERLVYLTLVNYIQAGASYQTFLSFQRDMERLG